MENTIAILGIVGALLGAVISFIASISIARFNQDRIAKKERREKIESVYEGIILFIMNFLNNQECDNRQFTILKIKCYLYGSEEIYRHLIPVQELLKDIDQNREKIENILDEIMVLAQNELNKLLGHSTHEK